MDRLLLSNSCPLSKIVMRDARLALWPRGGGDDAIVHVIPNRTIHTNASCWQSGAAVSKSSAEKVLESVFPTYSQSLYSCALYSYSLHRNIFMKIS